MIALDFLVAARSVAPWPFPYALPFSGYRRHDSFLSSIAFFVYCLDQSDNDMRQVGPTATRQVQEETPKPRTGQRHTMDSTDTGARAHKRRRTDDSTDKTPPHAVAVWDLLADEDALAVLSHCAPADLGRVSAVNWRLRCLALDERLWKALYDAAFPVCGTFCIAHVGRSVAGLDLAALVERGLDLMLDPTNATAGCALPLPEEAAALGDDDYAVGRKCQRHWPDVVAARGYRWAYAVAAVGRPRFFGPHLDGSPPSLVGRSCSRGSAYRGDLVDIRDDDERLAYVAHGYATADAVCFVPRGSSTGDAIVARGASGQWVRGVLEGHAVAWCRPAQRSLRPQTDYRDQCVGFYQGLWVDGCPHGNGVLIGPDYLYPQVACHAPSVVRSGAWYGGLPGHATRAWSVVSAEGSACAGVGTLATSTDAPKTGIVRTAKGDVAFVGEVDEWRPAMGRLTSRDGDPTYDGDVCAEHGGHKGRLTLADGRTIDLDGRGDDPNMDVSPEPESDHHSVPAVVVAYPNGDRVRWRAGAASPVAFIYADGRTCEPALGWHTAACSLAPRVDPAVRLLLDGTPFAAAQRHALFLAHDSIEDLVFWPRTARPSDALVHALFLDHMAAHHGPRWVQCRAAVRLLWGLDGITATPPNP